MAYRNDIDALAARDEALAREVADKQREHADVQRLLEEAMAAEAAMAREHDVMVGRTRLRRIAIASAVLVTAGGAAGAFYVQRRVTYRDAVVTAEELADRQQQIARDEKVAYDLALGSKGLEPVALEVRFVGGTDGFATVAELDAELGQAVEPWHEFLYTRDAQVRPAIASDIRKVYTFDAPVYEFVKDSYGGVWRVQRRVTPSRTDVVRVAGCAPVRGFGTQPPARVTRDLWLLPLGSSFRGDLEVAYAAPQLSVSYPAGSCEPPA